MYMHTHALAARASPHVAGIIHMRAALFAEPRCSDRQPYLTSGLDSQAAHNIYAREGSQDR